MGEEKNREEIPALAGAESKNSGIGCGAFGAAIPTVVQVAAVPILFAVGFIVLLVVGDEVGKGEPIMAGDEIEARMGAAPIAEVEVAAAGESGGEFSDTGAGAFPETANAIAVTAVPFGPEHGKIADLVAIWAKIPGFRDEFHIREDGVLVDDVEKGA